MHSPLHENPCPFYFDCPPSLVAQSVKNLPAMRETQVRSLAWEVPLEEGMTTHCSILACRIPWTEEPSGHSPWSRKESDTTERLSTAQHILPRGSVIRENGATCFFLFF